MQRRPTRFAATSCDLDSVAAIPIWAFHGQESKGLNRRTAEGPVPPSVRLARTVATRSAWDIDDRVAPVAAQDEA